MAGGMIGGGIFGALKNGGGSAPGGKNGGICLGGGFCRYK